MKSYFSKFRNFSTIHIPNFNNISLLTNLSIFVNHLKREREKKRNDGYFVKFGVDDFFCFEGKPVSLILSHKRAATRAALRSCLLKTLPRASAFIRRVETTRVVRHYTGQWTRYERDRRERERENATRPRNELVGWIQSRGWF